MYKSLLIAIIALFSISSKIPPSVNYVVAQDEYLEINPDNVAQLQIITQLETSLVQDIAWLRDNKFILSGDFGIRIYNLEDVSVPIGTLSGTSENILTIDVYGDKLVQAYDDVILWDLSSNEQLAVYSPKDYIMDVAFSPDGKWFAAGARQDSLYLWTLDESQQLTLSHDLSLLSVTFSPDSEVVAAVGDRSGMIKRWHLNSSSAAELPDFEINDTGLNYITFSPDGLIVGIAAGQEVYLLDSSTGEVIQTFSAVGELVTQFSFHPSQPLLAVTGGYEGSIQIWNIETGELISELKNANGFTGRNLFNSNGTLVATVLIRGTNDSIVTIWGIPIEP